VSDQALLTLGDAASTALFIGASILVSISFAPILLSVQPAPPVQLAKPGGLKALFTASPLGTIGIFLLGSIYASQSGIVPTATVVAVEDAATWAAEQAEAEKSDEISEAVG
jgi:hypothetical protein